MPADSPDPDPLAAELAAIEYRQENGDLRDFVTHDSPRLLAAVEAALAIHRTDERALLCAGCADVWPCQDYRAISGELLGKEDSGPAADDHAVSGQARGGSTNPTPDCGGPRKPPGATEVWWCDTHGECHGQEDGDA